jgi:uncharacterized protein YjbI with pentapeptide repeats
MVATPSSFPAAPRLPPELSPIEDVELSADVHWEGLSIGVDLSGQVTEDPVIGGCRLTGAALVGTDLIRARVNDTVFERCDLSGVILSRAVLTRVQFDDCRLSGADLSGAKLRDVGFHECRLVDASFRMASGDRVRFERCDLSRADLYAAELPGAYLFHSNLSETEISKATLTGARFHGSTVERISGIEALRGGTIGSTQIMPVAFQLLAVMGITVDDEAEPGQGSM